MSSIFDKFRVRTAVDGRYKHHFDPTHITTTDFFQLTPMFVKEVVPNTDITLNAQLFSRLEPLVRPTFGRCDFNLRAFFVPYYLVQQSFRDMYEAVVHSWSNGDTPSIPAGKRYITNKTLFDTFFVQDTGNYWGTYVTENDVYDVYFYDSHTDTTQHVYDVKYYKFNARGRHLYKVLTALGYRLPTRLTADDVEVKFDALPLLSLLKIYLDFYYPAQYVGDSYHRELSQILYFDGSNLAVNRASLQKIFVCILYSTYKPDYFTSAFDSPLGPDAGIETRSFNIPDPNSLAGSVVSDSEDLNNTPVAINGSAGFSQYVLNSLKRLTDYFRRAQFVGSRVGDRFKSRFGIDLSDDHRAVYLGSKDFPVQIGDVLSTADTDNAGLADYAGRGIAVGDNSWKFHAKDYGIIIVCMSLIPRVSYCQGISRDILDVNYEDLWQPDFDGLGCQAISRMELITALDGHSQLGSFNSAACRGVFGFTPRYSHKKVMLDKLTGDFTIPSINAGEDSWHLARLFNTSTAIMNSVVHSRSFLEPYHYYETPSLNASKIQYDRLFQNTEPFDHFRVFTQFNCTLFSPMKPLYDMYEFDSEHGQEVTMTVNGGNVH